MYKNTADFFWDNVTQLIKQEHICTKTALIYVYQSGVFITMCANVAS